MDATLPAELERIRQGIGQEIRQKFREKLDACAQQSPERASLALEEVRIDSFGKKSALQHLLRQLGELPSEHRNAVGSAVNLLKQEMLREFEETRARLEEKASAQLLEAERIDSTLSERPRRIGTLHPTGQVIEEVIAIFGDMGFRSAEGPDVEDDFHNFIALNFPPDHPARQMHDTFYLRGERRGSSQKLSEESSEESSEELSEELSVSSEPWILRTHTSPVQVRTMLRGELPIRIIAPGRCYRSDSDQTHTPMFHQVEGLVIDECTHFGHLKSCLSAFVRAFFEQDSVGVRFRPSYFPFTEPSAEMDIACVRKEGALSLVEEISPDSEWLEILGCGMVHPNVLQACNLDPEKVQGFAFGMGIERLAMLKYGIADLRTMFEGDVAWLEHYGFSPLDAPSLLRGLRPQAC